MAGIAVIDGAQTRQQRPDKRLSRIGLLPGNLAKQENVFDVDLAVELPFQGHRSPGPQVYLACVGFAALAGTDLQPVAAGFHVRQLQRGDAQVLPVEKDIGVVRNRTDFQAAPVLRLLDFRFSGPYRQPGFQNSRQLENAATGTFRTDLLDEQIRYAFFLPHDDLSAVISDELDRRYTHNIIDPTAGELSQRDVDRGLLDTGYSSHDLDVGGQLLNDSAYARDDLLITANLDALRCFNGRALATLMI